VCTNEHPHISTGAGVTARRSRSPLTLRRDGVAFLHGGPSPSPYRRSIALTPRQILGNAGEQLALEHYLRLGYELVARNHRTRTGELDLVVADRRAIVFVEVKTSLVGRLDPVDSLTPRKIARLRRLAMEWLASAPERPRRREIRFDAVAVVLDGSGRLVSLEQFEGIA
jgi:putative endonuclease